MAHPAKDKQVLRERTFGQHTLGQSGQAFKAFPHVRDPSGQPNFGLRGNRDHALSIRIIGTGNPQPVTASQFYDHLIAISDGTRLWMDDRVDAVSKEIEQISRYLRMRFVQAAKVVLMRPYRWPDFSFGDWLTRASERMHRNKLAIALADKLARTAWSILRHKTAFEAPRDEVAEGI